MLTGQFTVNTIVHIYCTKVHIIHVMSLGNKRATSVSFVPVTSHSALLRSEIWKAPSFKRKYHREERHCQCAG